MCPTGIRVSIDEDRPIGRIIVFNKVIINLISLKFSFCSRKSHFHRDFSDRFNGFFRFGRNVSAAYKADQEQH